MGALTDALKNFGPFVSPLIFALFPVCLTLLIISVVWSRKILKSMSVNNEIDYKNTSFNWINFCYSAFIALVSIFPLLGMLGTVLALLSLDITGGATQEPKANFFLALDTTAWGLVFSIFFKVLNSVFQTTVESAIEKIDILVKSHYTKKGSSRK